MLNCIFLYISLDLDIELLLIEIILEIDAKNLKESKGGEKYKKSK